MKYKQFLLNLLCLLGMLNISGLLTAQQYQITPECSIEMETNKYIVYFTLPNYTLEDEENHCDYFTKIAMADNDYDVMDEPGYPELPFYSLRLLLPLCASDVRVSILSSNTTQEYPHYPIIPAYKGSIVNFQEEYTELDPDCFNADYYNSGYTIDYPNGFYNSYYDVSNIYTVFGYNGITFSIFPFSYQPDQGYIDVLQTAVFEIEFDCDGLIAMIDEMTAYPDFNSTAAQLYYDSFNEMGVSSNTGENGTYLIIASHRDMATNLAPYVQYKQGQNYITEVLYLDDYGTLMLGDSTWIKHLIEHNNILPNPNFVLLVGNLEDIPPCGGTNDPDDPYTDDCYHPLIGRWIIGEETDYWGDYADLRNIIEKTIETETNFINPYSTAALFSGTDSHNMHVDEVFYQNIEDVANTSFYLMGIPYTLYDGRYYSSNSQALWYMTNAIQNNPRFFIYRGHGGHNNYTAAIASPYWLYADQIPALSNGDTGPLGFGFACGLNTYETDYNFGARWIASNGAGGAAFYGATTDSYRSANNVLAKQMFRSLRLLTNFGDNFPISLWIRISELTYSLPLRTATRRMQTRKYVLIGDPTLSVYGMDYVGNYEPFHAPHKDFLNDGEANIIDRTEVYDMSGHLLTTIHHSQNVTQLPLQFGVYIVKTIFSDGTSITNKIIK